MLHRILLIAKRDYVASVMRKAFLVGLVLAPLLFGGSLFGIALLRVTDGNKDKRIAILDRTGVAAAAIIKEADEKGKLLASFGDGPNVQGHYVFENVPVSDGNPIEQKLALSNRVRRGDLFAFVEINPEALHPAKNPDASANFYTGAGGIDQTQLWLAGPINDALRRIRLSQLGIDADHSIDVIATVPMTRMSLISRNETTGVIQESRKGNLVEGITVPFVLLFLMMMIVMIGAAPMLAAVAEDKMQRVFEMLLASSTPFELIMGKVLASVGRSLTSSIFYVIGGILALEGMALAGFIRFDLLPWFFVYLIAEVTMLSALGAALGAACSAPRDAQQLTPLLILPVMLPVFLLVPLAQQPNGAFATVLSLIPPFTPLVMIMRQAMPGGVPAWQPWVGLIGVTACAFLITWAAARIFRVGILLQGKPPRIGDILRWAVRG
jgi:ABC-2 type transport system permease protein